MRPKLAQRSYEVEVSEIRGIRRLSNQVVEELPRAKARLIESETLAMTGRMAQFISHDLRNQLSTICASVEFMSELRRTPSEREQLLEDVHVVIQEMTDLLDSLLMFTKSGQALHLCWGSLTEMVEHAACMVRSHPDARDVNLVIQNGTSIACTMDCKKLESAVYNLLLNACQAARRGLPPRNVKVTLTEAHRLVHVRVIDSGPGVPACIRETLFQPFLSTEGAGGMGLGLAIVARNVKEHGGYVDLEDTSPGHTVFGLHLSKFGPESLAPKSQS